METTTETPVESRNVPIPCWTILYSATKNGETKCGECYSNAISVSAAKADCLAKLERFGYGNVSILAIEAGDSDCAKMTEDEMRKGRTDTLSITEAEEAEEDDTEGEDISDDGDDSVNDVGDNDAGDDTGDDSGDAGGDDVGDDAGDDSGNAGEDDSGDDADSDGNDDADAEDGDGEDGEDGDGDDSDEGKELSDEEKSALKDEYKSTFREVMLSCKFEGRSFIDLTIPEKTQFFSALNVKWKKNDPKDFMSEEEQDQLESIVVNPQ